jgi:tRNA1Val (adenine37-N6)-methyltransferase
MAAQRNAMAHVEAVELDAAAATQATANFRSSLWSTRLTLHAASLGQYAATQPAPFDHIICNPPFFRHSLRSPDAQRTTARHTAEDTLTFTELVAFAARFLNPLGQLSVLLPPAEMHHLEREAHGVGLYPNSRVIMRHRPGSKPLRHITTFSRMVLPIAVQEFPLHEADTPEYSSDFNQLLSPFYLAL